LHLNLNVSSAKNLLINQLPAVTVMGAYFVPFATLIGLKIIILNKNVLAAFKQATFHIH
jgi:hypothetical protein